MKSIEQWRGKRDAVALEPEGMVFRFEAAPPGKDKCKGCSFHGQWSDVCKRAAARAVELGGPDCDAGVIYRLPDLRQIDCVVPA